MTDEWPFDEPKNLAVFTTKRILNEGAPILGVVHDNEDGVWQFVDGGLVETEDVALVSLYYITRLDPSVLALADLPLGWEAWRYTLNDPWQRSKTDPLNQS